MKRKATIMAFVCHGDHALEHCSIIMLFLFSPWAMSVMLGGLIGFCCGLLSFFLYHAALVLSCHLLALGVPPGPSVISLVQAFRLSGLYCSWCIMGAEHGTIFVTWVWLCPVLFHLYCVALHCWPICRSTPINSTKVVFTLGRFWEKCFQKGLLCSSYRSVYTNSFRILETN